MAKRRKKKGNFLIIVTFVAFMAFVIYLLYNFDSKENVKTNNNTEIKNNKKDSKTTTKEVKNDTKEEKKEQSQNNEIKKEEAPKTETEQNNVEQKAKDENLDVSSIELNGQEKVELSLNEKYNDPGAKAINKNGEDISKHIKVESNLDTTKKGEYTITYSIGNYIVIRFITVK